MSPGTDTTSQSETHYYGVPRVSLLLPPVTHRPRKEGRFFKFVGTYYYYCYYRLMYHERHTVLDKIHKI